MRAGSLSLLPFTILWCFLAARRGRLNIATLAGTSANSMLRVQIRVGRKATWGFLPLGLLGLWLVPVGAPCARLNGIRKIAAGCSLLNRWPMLGRLSHLAIWVVLACAVFPKNAHNSLAVVTLLWSGSCCRSMASLMQRFAEGILYGCMCLLSWQLLADRGDSTRLNG